MSDECRFCGETRVLEDHHIIPRRFDGPDTDENVVTVCPTCHRLLERLYNKEFYEAIGAYEPSTSPYQQGVKDTLVLQLNIASKDPEIVEHDPIFEETKEQAVSELLPTGYGLCDACKLPRREVPCEHCRAKPLGEVQ